MPKIENGSSLVLELSEPSELAGFLEYVATVLRSGKKIRVSIDAED